MPSLTAASRQEVRRARDAQARERVKNEEDIELELKMILKTKNVQPRREWNVQKILATFEQFREEHGRLPTMEDLRSGEYSDLLPSKSAVGRWGGLKWLRQQVPAL